MYRETVTSELLQKRRGGFLNCIMTCDKHGTPYKRMSVEWRKIGEKVLIKVKLLVSARKVLTPVLWESKGVLMIDYLHG